MKKIAKPIIELSNICRSDKKCSIERLDLSVPDGDSFAVVYTSPGSISLLLDILSGKVQPKKGKIFFKGDEITGTKNNFGVIKKDAPIPKRKTVADYAAAPVSKRGLPRSLTSVLVEKEIKLFGLDGIAQDTFAQLSDQAAARALIFSAYMCSHELIVIEEPFSKLSPEEREHELAWLDDLRKKNHISLLVFTQSVDAAVSIADYVMVTDNNTASKGIIAVDKNKKDRAKEQINELL